MPIDVGPIIFGQPWLYDLDVTVYDRSNSYSFEFKGKRIKLVQRPPKAKPEVKEKVDKRKRVKNNKTKALHIIGSKAFKQEIKEEAIVFALVTKEACLESQVEHPTEVACVLRKFQNMFLKDLPDELLPMCDIHHAIDRVPSETLPNLPHYRVNPTEHAELKKQVNELICKGLI